MSNVQKARAGRCLLEHNQLQEKKLYLIKTSIKDICYQNLVFMRFYIIYILYIQQSCQSNDKSTKKPINPFLNPPILLTWDPNIISFCWLRSFKAFSFSSNKLFNLSRLLLNYNWSCIGQSLYLLKNQSIGQSILFKFFWYLILL